MYSYLWHFCCRGMNRGWCFKPFEKKKALKIWRNRRLHSTYSLRIIKSWKSENLHQNDAVMNPYNELTWLSSNVSIRFSSALSKGVPVLLWVSYDSDITLQVCVISASTYISNGYSSIRIKQQFWHFHIDTHVFSFKQGRLNMQLFFKFIFGNFLFIQTASIPCFLPSQCPFLLQLCPLCF